MEKFKTVTYRNEMRFLTLPGNKEKKRNLSPFIFEIQRSISEIAGNDDRLTVSLSTNPYETTHMVPQ